VPGETDHEVHIESQRLPTNADPDEAVLKSLAEVGSDASKLHLVEFFLYFAREADATSAGAEIAKKGFQVKLAEAADHSTWRVVAAKTLFPELSALQEIRVDFTALASSLNGEYDGWETEVVR
jgi:hypothetical protein